MTTTDGTIPNRLPDAEELARMRERILTAMPELRKMQEEIDVLLGGTTDPMRRLDILFMLLSEKVDAMVDALGALDED